MKYVLRYEMVENLNMAQVAVHLPAHRQRWEEFRRQGTLLLIGPFADPQLGAMGVFTTEAAATEFANSDPFVEKGLVRHWHVLPWNEVLGEMS